MEINFGANTCGACIRAQANTGKYSWRIIYVLVSCQGVIFCQVVYTQPERTLEMTVDMAPWCDIGQHNSGSEELKLPSASFIDSEKS